MFHETNINKNIQKGDYPYKYIFILREIDASHILKLYVYRN